MYILNGRLIFQQVIFNDDWTDEEEIPDTTGSVILCPATIREFKKRWSFIKASGEPYNNKTLEAMANYKDFSFLVPEARRVDECIWLPIYEKLNHQYKCVIELLNRRRYGVFFDTGTGKTVVTIQYLYNKLQGQQGRNVIIVTKSIVVPQFQHAVGFLPESITKNNRIIVVSYDTAYKYEDINFDVVFLDESHLVKTKTSLRYFDIKRIAKPETPYVFILTATPQDKNKYEIIVQFSILSDYILHPRGASSFKRRYFELNDYNSVKRDRSNRIHEVNETLSQLSVYCKTDDVLNIPPFDPPIIINCYKGKELTEYKIMNNDKDRILELNGIKFKGKNISSQRSFLRQITNGFIYETYVRNPDDPIEKWKTSKRAHYINSNKLDELKKNIMFRNYNGAIIYTLFDEDNRMIAKMLDELGVSYKMILKCSNKIRDQIIMDFKSKKFEFLIIKATSGGAGLDLEMIQTIHWYTMPEAYLDIKQGRGRIHRYGQKQKQQEYFYIGSPLEKDIYRNVVIKKKSYTDETFRHFQNINK